MAHSIAVCRKCKGHDRLEAYLRHETDAQVYEVRCQKICKGPVAGIEVDGRMEWFERVRSAKAMTGLRRLAKGKTKLVPALKKRRLKSRSGCAPR